MRTLRIDPERPFSLELTAERLGRFGDGLDRFDGRELTRLVHHRGEPLLLRVVQEGPASRAVLRVALDGRAARLDGAADRARDVLGRMLGFDRPVADFYRRFRGDPVLGAAVRDFRGLRVAGSASLFEALVTAILAQQVNLAFAYSIRGELVQRFGRRARIGRGVHADFPTPRRLAGVPHETLRSLRLSNAKARAIRELAEAFRSGAVRESQLATCDDETVIARLIELHGVGRWTAEIGLLRGLGRPDVFPAADLAVVKYLATTLLGRRSVASEREMRTFSRAWRPHRSLALVYAYAEMVRRQRGSEERAS